jgi:hypothetical protein
MEGLSAIQAGRVPADPAKGHPMSNPEDIDSSQIPGNILRQAAIDEFPGADEIDIQCQVLITLVAFLVKEGGVPGLLLYRVVQGFLNDEQVFPFLQRLEAAMKVFEVFKTNADELIDAIKEAEAQDPPVRH